ncbi:MAG: sigma 54-interacting transcriptional regulator, partial [Planctomycetota bacterium]|nr:sigma 54-interacting transcriptional regulator [Planctomycetota bacterium]
DVYKRQLFLDEIGNIPLEVQGKLLRVLEHREFRRVGDTQVRKIDVRIIAATNKNLKEMVKQEIFREDLYYRLNVFPIYIPPLRERREDIPVLACHFLQEFSRTMRKNIKGFSKEAMRQLIEYNWPGNVRELRNLVERVVIMTEQDFVSPSDMLVHTSNENVIVKSDTPRTASELKETKRRLKNDITAYIEKRFILEALERNNYNISNAAREVEMDRRNFQKLMKKCGIKPRFFEER